eukprot:6213497-Amphidinium_carterae.2
MGQQSFVHIRVSEWNLWRNLISAKWVYKFKAASSSEAERLRGLPVDHPDRVSMVFSPHSVKHLRARMVVRAFKDTQWHSDSN